jgi:hypothetical protein
MYIDETGRPMPGAVDEAWEEMLEWLGIDEDDA